MARRKKSERAFLIDTNIFLEFLLAQQRTEECVALMTMIEKGKLVAYVTSFALHGIEVILDRFKKTGELESFLDRVMAAKGLTVYPTSPEEEKNAVSFVKKFSLDFDDALHYSVAKSLGLTLVSFDKDFDRTDLRRAEPGRII